MVGLGGGLLESEERSEWCCRKRILGEVLVMEIDCKR